MNVFVKTVHTDKAPKAIGPYSQATKLGDFVYLSGQAGASIRKPVRSPERPSRNRPIRSMKNIGACSRRLGPAL